MDKKLDAGQILHALEELGINAHAERFKTEAYYLTTLIEQGKTVAEALATVSDLELRRQIKPVMYYITLRALILALARLQAITSEQARDFEEFLKGSIDVLV
ncbi:MAG TPA: hypothetical protein VFV38_35870 [Ktedonobacteraceae bacterium]|nr:hypothetical protein [Ktedonobacteraceae bacterium]